MSLRDQIIQADDRPVELVDVPEWGVKLEIRGLMSGERTALLKAAAGPDGQTQLADILSQLVVLCAYEPDTGERVFAPEDVAILERKSGAVVEQVAQVAARLSGLTPEADDAGKGSSIPTTTSGSASTSPSSSAE